MVKTSKPKINSIVLDVLKPHKPNIVDFAKELKGLKSVREVQIAVKDVDEKTETVSVILDGKNLSIKNINNKIESFGAVTHSIDKVIVN